jgi:hypothetical protein
VGGSGSNYRDATTGAGGSRDSLGARTIPTAATTATASLQSIGDRPQALLTVHALLTHALVSASAIALALLAANADHARALAQVPALSEPRESKGPAPLDAITTILDAFRTHPVVGLDEVHADEGSHAFRLSLIRDPRFPILVNDILVEFGNSRYQDLMDRFIRGEPVADEDLKKVWQNTTLAHTIWDRPIYEDFYRAVRAINASLPPERRLRVLLGDPPFDWDAVRTPDDLQSRSFARSKHPADIVVREVIAKQRRALVIYGALHLWKQGLQGPNLIEHLEKDGGIKTFVVLTHPHASLDALRANHESWPVPSIALTRGSSVENQMDAILYIGPLSSRRKSQLSPAVCSDAAYREMRTRRMVLAGDPKAEEQLTNECAAVR